MKSFDENLGAQEIDDSIPGDNECIVLTNGTLTKSLFKDVMFFSLAEGGAMGEPGAVVFYDKSGQQYYFNYVYGDVDIWKVEKLFPTFANCTFGMFGIDSEVPSGWNYVNLGMGNHLIVHDKVYKQFCDLLGEDKEPQEIYGVWQEIARQILREK